MGNWSNWYRVVKRCGRTDYRYVYDQSTRRVDGHTETRNRYIGVLEGGRVQRVRTGGAGLGSGVGGVKRTSTTSAVARYADEVDWNDTKAVWEWLEGSDGSKASADLRAEVMSADALVERDPSISAEARKCVADGKVSSGASKRTTAVQAATERVARLEQIAGASETFADFLAVLPKPKYHATRAAFDRLDVSKAGSNTGAVNSGLGIFFLDERPRAEAFGDEHGDRRDGGELQVLERWVDLQRPLDLTWSGVFGKAEQAPLIVELIGGDRMPPDAALAWLNDNIGLGEIADFTEAIYAKANKALMIAAGYDGIIGTFGKDDDGNEVGEVVVFENDQIRTREELEQLWRRARGEVTQQADSDGYDPATDWNNPASPDHY